MVLPTPTGPWRITDSPDLSYERKVELLEVVDVEERLRLVSYQASIRSAALRRL